MCDSFIKNQIDLLAAYNHNANSLIHMLKIIICLFLFFSFPSLICFIINFDKTYFSKIINYLILNEFKKDQLVEFNKINDIDTNSETYKIRCGICLEDYVNKDELKKLTCEHIFHRNCINVWLLAKMICPFCGKKYVMENMIQLEYLFKFLNLLIIMLFFSFTIFSGLLFMRLCHTFEENDKNLFEFFMMLTIFMIVGKSIMIFFKK